MSANVDIHAGAGGCDQSPSDGTPFFFGTTDVTFPEIPGFYGRVVTTADLEPEVFEQAKNGDGQTEQVAETNQTNRMLRFQMSGYIDDSYDPNSVPTTGTLTLFGTDYFCFFRKISTPIPKGNYAEVSVDMESFPLITS